MFLPDLVGVDFSRLADAQILTLAANAMPLLERCPTNAIASIWGLLFRRLRAIADSSAVSQQSLTLVASQLSCVATVAPLFAALLSDVASPTSDQYLVDALLFYDTVLMCKRLDVLHAPLLHALAACTRIAPVVWSILSRSPALFSNGDSVSPLPQATVDTERVLSLWAKCSLRVLATLDDEEFFSQKFFLDFGTICTMIPVLTDITWKLYSAFVSKERYRRLPRARIEQHQHQQQQQQPSAEEQRTADLRGALTALLYHLYDRNSRRQFCSPNAWVVRELSRMSASDTLLKLVIHTIPFSLPFTDRIAIFHMIIRDDRNMRPAPFGSAHSVTIRRNFLVEDAFASLNPLGPALKGYVRVSFIDQHGMPEVGIDGGGLFKELMTQLTRQLFDPQFGLFCMSADHRAYPNPSAVLLNEERLQHFQFAGRILGKCIYEELLVELPLAKFFLAKMLGKESFGSPLNDLIFLDPVLYKHLRSLKGHDVSDLYLYFSVIDNDLGENRVVELIPGGKDIAVTNENKANYILLMAAYRVHMQIRLQSQAFLSGLSDLIDPEWLRLFCQDELQFVISGSPAGIDDQGVLDWRSNTVYGGGYSDRHPVIDWFWEIVAKMTPQQRSQLLSFVTSCSRPPLLGFRHLNPPFSIVRSTENDHLPTAATCINLLKLPQFSTKDVLRDRLLYAISSNSGFGLS